MYTLGRNSERDKMNKPGSKMEMLTDQEGNRNEGVSSESDNSEPKRAVNIQHKETNTMPKCEPRLLRFPHILRQSEI